METYKETFNNYIKHCIDKMKVIDNRASASKLYYTYACEGQFFWKENGEFTTYIHKDDAEFREEYMKPLVDIEYVEFIILPERKSSEAILDYFNNHILPKWKEKYDRN